MSMYIAVAALALMVAPFAIAWHLRRATARLAYAEEIWDVVEQSARVLLEDRHLDPKVADFVEFVIQKIGSGTLTRTALKAMLRRPTPATPLPPLAGGQSVQMGRFILSSVFFDSLHTSVSGIILRRWLYWLASTVTDKKAVVSEPQVAPVYNAADDMWHSAKPDREFCPA